MKICKITAFMLVAALAISLCTGCASKQKEKTDEEAEINGTVVITTDNFIVTQSMMEYFFNSYYRTFINKYADKLEQMNLDTDKSLKEQKYSQEYSWFDYLIAQTLRQVQQLLYLNEEALEEGLQLSKENQQTMEDTMARYDAAASKNNTSTLYYLKNLFGESVNETTIRKCLRMQMLAAQYTAKLEEEQAYTEEDLEAYYEENRTDYHLLDLIYAVVPDDRADTFADAENEDVFVALLQSLLLEETPELSKEELADKVENAYVRRGGYVEDLEFSKWAFDPQRSVYDTYMESSGEDGKTVVYMLLPAVCEPMGEVVYRDNTPTKNLKYILFEAGEDVSSDTVRKKADAVFDEWTRESGEDPEGVFDALMQEYGGNASLDLERGRLDSDLEDWIFDEERNPGDAAVITVEEGTYILYMLADGDLQWKVQVRADMLQEALDKALEAFADKYDIRYSEEALYDIAQIYI